MKRTMRYLSECEKRPVYWRRIAREYRAIRQGQGAWKSLADYRVGMELRANQQRKFVRAA